jgi:hypothetical protein
MPDEIMLEYTAAQLLDVHNSQVPHLYVDGQARHRHHFLHYSTALITLTLPGAAAITPGPNADISRPLF